MRGLAAEIRGRTWNDPILRPMTSPTHTFHAVAFVENLTPKELAPAFPEAKRSARALVRDPRRGNRIRLSFRRDGFSQRAARGTRGAGAGA